MVDKPCFTHFVVDDKFIPDSIKCFQDADLTVNKYYCLTKNPLTVKYINGTNVEYINIQQLESVFDKLKDGDVVVLHCLYALPAHFICKIPKDVKVVWYAWGFDIYSNGYPIRPLIALNEVLLPMTKSRMKYFLRLKDLFGKIRVIADNRGYHTKSSLLQYKAISRVDFFAGVFPSEYDMLRQQCDFFQARRITHNYIHPEEFALDNITEPCNVRGNNILLGNSAAYLCNHIDIMHSLYEQTTQRDYNVYCPLSYGGNRYYINAVVKEGKALFGDRFLPLLDYLPIDEYTKVIQSCSSIILGYKQQAATCNCLTSLWNGLKVFLPKASMNFEEYRNVEGLRVYSIEEDLNDTVLSTKPDFDILEQRRILSEIYSYERWKKDLKESIEIMMS